jgi:hypothetical protein
MGQIAVTDQDVNATNVEQNSNNSVEGWGAAPGARRCPLIDQNQ